MDKNNDNYISTVSNRIRSCFKSEEIPDKGLELLFGMYAVLALTKGTSVTDSDVHDAWSLWATLYDPNSDSLVPFSELSSDIQSKDSKFTEAIVKIAEGLK